MRCPRFKNRRELIQLSATDLAKRIKVTAASGRIIDQVAASCRLFTFADTPSLTVYDISFDRIAELTTSDIFRPGKVKPCSRQ